MVDWWNSLLQGAGVQQQSWATGLDGPRGLMWGNMGRDLPCNTPAEQPPSLSPSQPVPPSHLSPRYEACKDDLTCARNWVSDWQWGPQGNNCSQDCVPYSQMYRDGRELCENIWGDSFVAAREPCPCLSLTGSDADPLPEDGDSSEEPDSTKAGSPRGPCPASGLLRRGLRKRSVFMEDVEGSGSGF
uniref:Folate receptor-like domain-containing protein n=1 Tax=Terrapene triunguis TaxID=2587831 RepID=A0A674JUE1_9SAUR